MSDPGEADLEQAILTLLSRRERTATICPSEVARQLGEIGRAHV